MDTLCGLFGKSRQAYYQRINYNYKEEIKEEILLQLIERERKLMPRLGGRKLMVLLNPRLPPELKLGRDKFFDFLRKHNLLAGNKRRRVRTTYSNHWLHKYPNLIKEFTPDTPNQLWVSDITYIETKEGFVYLSLITDGYSRKIIDWSVGSTLEAIYTLRALDMALKQLPKQTSGLIHHSDRGVQYCCGDYVKKLCKYKVAISMTEDGNPRENAIAERVNGILKEEWLNQIKPISGEQAIKEIERTIQIYNCCRPHSSIDMKTPQEAHEQTGELKRRWKAYYKNRVVVQII